MVDQLDPSFVQRVNAKVSTVIERYLFDDEGVVPKNTRRTYLPKQAEWMVLGGDLGESMSSS